MATILFHLSRETLWRRMERAVETIQERLEMTARTIEQAGIPYAIIGESAVRAWVAQADEAAVRTTRDVDILLRRSEWSAAKTAMEAAGFVHRHSSGIEMFLASPEAKARDAVHVLFAGKKVFPDRLLPAPDVSESENIQAHRMLTLEALVRMTLNSYQEKKPHAPSRYDRRRTARRILVHSFPARTRRTADGIARHPQRIVAARIVFLQGQGTQLKAIAYRMQELLRFVINIDLFLKK